MPGHLIGVGVGPGDPRLLTLAAVDALKSADVVAFHCKPNGSGSALAAAQPHIPEGTELLRLEYPVTVGETTHPGGYAGALADFYAESTQRLADLLDQGKTVAILALGDPLLYSSYQHLHRALKDHAETARIIPGISSFGAAASVIGAALGEDREVVAIVPGTLSQEELTRRLRDSDAAVVMKLGRRFDVVRQALAQAGVLDRAQVVIRVGMEGQTVIPAAEADPESIPYFAVVLVPLQIDASGHTHVCDPAATVEDPKPMGEVVVLGLGPGDEQWTTPETARELVRATDIVGYSTYVRRVPERAGQRRHLSDNKVEAERAAFALDLAKRGHRVAVVSSGDPGVFAMAAAVLETANDPLWRDVPVRVVPGMTAAQAVASRVGAPLGHDFGMISLSNRLKPWDQVERRVRALAGADMAFAVYNPASLERREHIRLLKKVVLEYQAPTTPVIVARAVGRAEEKVTITTLGEFDPEIVDMQTMVIVGASTTVAYDSAQGTRVYTSRRYGE